MPNQLAEDKRRVSYIEYKENYAIIKALAAQEHLEVSDILRKAVREFLARSAPKKVSASDK